MVPEGSPGFNPAPGFSASGLFDLQRSKDLVDAEMKKLTEMKGSDCDCGGGGGSW
jgi:hypothetical protein